MKLVLTACLLALLTPGRLSGQVTSINTQSLVTEDEKNGDLITPSKMGCQFQSPGPDLTWWHSSSALTAQSGRKYETNLILRKGSWSGRLWVAFLIDPDSTPLEKYLEDFRKKKEEAYRGNHHLALTLFTAAPSEEPLPGAYFVQMELSELDMDRRTFWTIAYIKGSRRKVELVASSVLQAGEDGAEAKKAQIAGELAKVAASFRCADDEEKK